MRRGWSIVVVLSCAALGAVLAVREWLTIVDHGALGADFRNPLWDAARDILHGESPYFPPTSSLLGNADPSEYPALYPPPLMLAVTPLAVFPVWVAYGIWVVVLAGVLLLSLWLVGVRDWRCYLVWGVSAAAAATLPQGNATPLLLLSVALMWRYRDRAWLAGAALAIAVAIKLWPAVIALWLVRTGRRRAAAISIALAALAIFVGWCVMGWDGLIDYPAMLRAHARATAVEGEFVVGLALNIGLSLTVATALGIGAAAMLLVVAWRVADERVSLAFVIGAALLASTLGWPQYLVLLVVPIAALSPTLSALWLFAFVPYVSMQLERQPDGGRLSRGLWTTTALAVVLAAITVVASRQAQARAAP